MGPPETQIHALESYLQKLVPEAAAALRQVYELVPEVSLGRVTAEAADTAVESLHAVSHRILPLCDDIEWLEQQTSELLLGGPGDLVSRL